MEFSNILKPTRKKVLFFVGFGIIFSLIYSFIRNIFSRAGGDSYLEIPFRVKVTGCYSSSFPNAIDNCSYQFIWGGIIASIVFWFVIYFIISYLAYRFSEHKV